jgi:hypothetical protein
MCALKLPLFAADLINITFDQSRHNVLLKIAKVLARIFLLFMLAKLVDRKLSR